MRLKIIERNGERCVEAAPEQMFKEAYASINMAQDIICKLADQNVGNLTRRDILKLVELIRCANSALMGLECWRKANPIPDDEE